MADLTRLIEEALEAGAVFAPFQGSRPYLTSWSFPPSAGRYAPDCEREIVRIGGELRPYDDPAEMIAWLEKGVDNGRPLTIGIMPDSLDCFVLDFDKGTRADIWAHLVPGCCGWVSSLSGRGIHAWYRRPQGFKRKDWKTRYRLVLPTLDPQGGCETEADLLIRSCFAKVATLDNLRSVLAMITDKEIVDMSLADLRTLTLADKDGPVSSGLRAITKAREGSRHDTLIAETGRMVQGDLRTHGADSLLGKMIVKCFDNAFPGKGDEASKVVQDVFVKREDEAAEESKQLLDKRKRIYETGQIDGDCYAVSRAGLASLLTKEGIKFGVVTRGRPKLMVDSGQGRGWEPFTKIVSNSLRGDLRAKYQMSGAEGTKKDWWMATEQFNADITSIAKRVKIDPFQDYLNLIGDWEYDDEAKAFMSEMPFKLWEFDEPREIVSWAFRAIMCGMVARQRWPGCKFDSVMVLRGDQGIGKSTFLRALFPKGAKYEELVGKCNLRLLEAQGGEKRLIENTMGKVVCEIPELKAVRNLEEVKDFITSQYDELRMAYDTDTIQVRRSSIFVATTNHYEPLRSDPSGNRRFLPVSITGLANGMGKEESYFLINTMLDNGNRDMWWGVAKAAVWSCKDEDECAAKFLTPDADMLAKLTANTAKYERVSILGDDVRQMIDGLTIADSMGGEFADREYVVKFLPQSTIYEHLGLTGDGRRVSNEDGGKVKSAMEACGWRGGRVRVYNGSGAVKQMACFWPANIDLTGKMDLDPAVLAKWLENARDGEPVSAGKFEEMAKELSLSQSQDDGDDIPF